MCRPLHEGIFHRSETHDRRSALKRFRRFRVGCRHAQESSAPAPTESELVSTSRHRTGPSPVLRAGGNQRGRSRFPELVTPAHGGKPVDVRLTVPRTWQARIVALLLVDSFAAKVGEPSLNSPRGHEHEDVLTDVSAWDVAFSASVIELGDTLLDSAVVAVHHHDQCYGDPVPPATVLFKLLGEAFADELFGGPTSSRRLQYPHLVVRPSHPLEEASPESLVLRVLAQQNDSHIPVHPSFHPLAISSESFIPPSISLASGLWVVTTPDFSRWSRSPFSPPR